MVHILKNLRSVFRYYVSATAVPVSTMEYGATDFFSSH